jgi:hypothetical protein
MTNLRFIKGLAPYIFPSLLLIGLLSIYFFVYIKFGIAENGEKSITISLSAIGLIFAFFQVFLNLNVQAARNKAQLRHTEYKELIKLLNSVSEILNDGLVKGITFKDVQGLVTSLLNKRNEFVSFVVHNDSYLFKGIKKNKVLVDTSELLHTFSVRTDKFRDDLEKIEKRKAPSTSDINWQEVILDEVTKMSWHNDVNQTLIKYNEKKHEVLKEVQICLR